MKIKLVLLSIVSFFSLCISAESFSFLFSEGETRWRITIDTRAMTYTHHNLSTGYKVICNCKSICASKNDDGIIINLEQGPLVVNKDKIDWIFFFIDSKIGSLATYQKNYFICSCIKRQFVKSKLFYKILKTNFINFIF